jgi:hypothetical protein
MAKKNFSGGLESLLGGGASKTEKAISESKKAPASEIFEEEKAPTPLPAKETPLVVKNDGLESIVSEDSKSSPIEKAIENIDKEENVSKEIKVITTSQTSNLSSVESYFEAVLGNQRVEKLKKIAERDKLSFEEVAKEAIDFYLDFQVELP